MKTIKQVSEKTGVSLSTLQRVAREGRIPAQQIAYTWFVDDDAEGFKTWLEDHWKQPRVKGRLKKTNSKVVDSVA